MTKPTRIQLAQSMSRTWHRTADEEDTLEAVMDPSYWAHVARNMSIGDKIEVLSETMEWYAELMVVAVGQTEVATKLLMRADLTGADEIAEEDCPYFVAYKGPKRRHAVLRKDDKTYVRDGFQTKEHANQYLRNHMKSMMVA